MNYLWNRICLFNNTPLIIATVNGNLEMFQLLLLQPGIELNHKNVLLWELLIILHFYFCEQVSNANHL